jgi:crotonobetainyl-CoA:carnitine CoA-transferase CaiB-like acyl-CoA transferase
MQDERRPGLLPLSGVRVVVLGQAIAGPMTGRLLANYGAEVIRVEWSGHIDRLRHALPTRREKRDVNSSARWPQYNAGVKSVGLDLRQDLGRQAFLDLVARSDVLIFNFAAHVMPALGLHPDEMLRANPRLVIALLTLFGEGSFREQPGLGDGLSAYTGFYWLTGWSDASPLLPQGPYTDYIAPALTATSIIAALEEVETTGAGQIIDVSELEFGSWFLMPEVLAAQAGHVSPIRNGFASNGPGLSVLLPTSGDDRWCTVTIESDWQWAALADLAGNPALALDCRFRHAGARLRHAEDVVAELSAWSSTKDRNQLVAELRTLGLASFGVADAADVQEDAALASRRHWVQVDVCDNGRPAYCEQFPMRFSAFDAHIGAPPDFSEHSHEVLKHIVGYTDEQLVELVSAGAVE